jgi:secondary thiamine-phosphate synthase enzyme
MTQAQAIIAVRTAGRGLVEVTREIAAWVGGQTIGQGLLTVFIRHTSASLLIQENAAPEVRTDLENFMERLVPEDPALYAHDDEGPDDMPSHIRSALTQTHLAIPVDGGKLLLGTWQGIYVFEHRRAPHRRELVLHLAGES